MNKRNKQERYRDERYSMDKWNFEIILIVETSGNTFISEL